MTEDLAARLLLALTALAMIDEARPGGALIADEIAVADRYATGECPGPCASDQCCDRARLGAALWDARTPA